MRLPPVMVTFATVIRRWSSDLHMAVTDSSTCFSVWNLHCILLSYSNWTLQPSIPWLGYLAAMHGISNWKWIFLLFVLKFSMGNMVLTRWPLSYPFPFQHSSVHGQLLLLATQTHSNSNHPGSWYANSGSPKKNNNNKGERSIQLIFMLAIACLLGQRIFTEIQWTSTVCHSCNRKKNISEL